MSKKIVVKVDLDCEKCKRKALRTVADIDGVNFVQVDLKEQKITVIGDADADAVTLINKLRKFGRSELLSGGPAKEPEKKQPEKKPDEKKDEKKDDKKDDKKEAPKKEEKKADPPKANPQATPLANITYLYLPGHCGPYRGALPWV